MATVAIAELQSSKRDVKKRFRERKDVKYVGKPVRVRRFAVSRFGFHFLPMFSLFLHVRRGYHEFHNGIIKEYR